MSNWTRHRIEVAREIIEQNQDTPMRLWAMDLSEALDEIERLRSEQERDLRDVNRFRGMARTYMNERDHYRAELDKVYELKVEWLKALPPPPIVLKGDAAETYRLQEKLNQILKALDTIEDYAACEDAIREVLHA